MNMNCQICNHAPLAHVFSLGYMPPVNWMVPVGATERSQVWEPTDLMHCPKCELVQLNDVPPQDWVFPPHYPYTSGSTKILRDNFDQQAEEAIALLNLKPGSLVIDIGSNDGTLLSCYQKRGLRVVGIEPTDIAKVAVERGITNTFQLFFNSRVAKAVRDVHGPASLITCCNCFAHIPDVHDVMEGIKTLLKPEGTFLSESH